VKAQLVKVRQYGMLADKLRVGKKSQAKIKNRKADNYDFKNRQRP
jgi:hypothetical protein